MSIVTQPRRRRNDDPPVVSVGTEHRDIGEPIPPRTGTWPDYRSELDPGDVEADPADWPDWTDDWHWEPTEPVAGRVRPCSPSQAEAEATRIAERRAGRIGEPYQDSPYAFKAGAYESLYGELYQCYLDAQALLQRARLLREFEPDETPLLDWVDEPTSTESFA
jgi:hypothetical protein